MGSKKIKCGSTTDDNWYWMRLMCKESLGRGEMATVYLFAIFLKKYQLLMCRRYIIKDEK